MINILLAAALLAAAYVLVFGVLLSVLHIVFSGIRIWRGRPSRFRWIIAGRSISVIAALLLLVPLLWIGEERVWKFSTWVYHGWETVAAVLVGAGLVLSVALPLVEAWRARSASSYVLSGMCLISFPFIALLVSSLTMGALSDIGMKGPTSALSDLPNLQDQIDRNFYELNSDGDRCAVWLRGRLGVPSLAERPANTWSSGDYLVHRFAFWTDTALRGVFFDAFDVFGCSASVLRNNRDSLPFSVMVLLFRLIYPVLFYATIIVLLRGIAARARTSLAEHTS